METQTSLGEAFADYAYPLIAEGGAVAVILLSRMIGYWFAPQVTPKRAWWMLIRKSKPHGLAAIDVAVSTFGCASVLFRLLALTALLSVLLTLTLVGKAATGGGASLIVTTVSLLLGVVGGWLTKNPLTAYRDGRAELVFWTFREYGDSAAKQYIAEAEDGLRAADPVEWQQALGVLQGAGWV